MFQRIIDKLQHINTLDQFGMAALAGIFLLLALYALLSALYTLLNSARQSYPWTWASMQGVVGVALLLCTYIFGNAFLTMM